MPTDVPNPAETPRDPTPAPGAPEEKPPKTPAQGPADNKDPNDPQPLDPALLPIGDPAGAA